MDRQQVIMKLVGDIAQAAGGSFQRTPEPDLVTDGEDSVLEYDKVMNTNMTVNYAASLNFIYRARSEQPRTTDLSMLDLCCGPGHFTIAASTHLGYKDVTVVDASVGMLAKADENFRRAQPNSRLHIQMGDVSALRPDRFEHYDLVALTNAAHHLPDLDAVRKTLSFADKVTRPSGLVMVTDMCRLPTPDLTKRFVEFAGADFLDHDMRAMYEDMMASMFAAWSADELASACPKDSERVWFQAVAAHLPFFQVMIGLPKGRTDLFIRDGRDWAETGIHRSEKAKGDWEATKANYENGLIRCIHVPKAFEQKKAA